MIVLLRLSVLFLLMLFPSLLFAEETPGYISAVRGNAFAISEEGVVRELKVHDRIRLRDLVVTEENSRLKIVFRDRTVVNLGQQSRFRVSDFAFNDASSRGRLKMEVSEGVFRVIGGKITKNSPESFLTDTPAASIGIRGSSFAGRVSKAGLSVYLESGKGIDVSNSAGSVALLLPGRGTQVRDWNSPPATPRMFNSTEQRAIMEESSFAQDVSQGSRIGSQAKVVNEATINESVNIAVGKNNTAAMGSVRISGSQVDGEVVNSAIIKQSTNVAAGKNNKATVGSIDVE